MRKPGRSAFFTVVLGLGVALGGCTTLLGDYTVSDSSGTDGSTTDGGGGGDVTVPPDGGRDTGTTDDSPTNDASDAPSCGVNQLLCNGTCTTQDAKNCGSCGHDCTKLPHVSGTGVTCNAGKCDVPPSACAPGFAHCSSNPDDGCEADLSQAGHCGTCTTTCSGATPVCSAIGGDAGAGFACASGCPSNTPTLCSGSCVDLTSNAQHCHDCANACPTVSNGQPACTNSVCGFTCNSGYHACGGACYSDSDIAHCGSACATCSAPANGSPTCSAGTCSFGCNAGYSPCGSTCVNLTIDTNNCGGCGLVCSLANATSTCTNSQCAVASCNFGFANCDNIASNGCESNLQTDANNCNRCGHSCQGGTCSAGVCQPAVFVSATLANSVTDFTTDGTVVAWLDGNAAVAEAMTFGASTRIVLASGALLTQTRAIAMSTNGNGKISWVQYDGTNSQHLVATSGVANSGTLMWTGAGVSNGLVYNPSGLDVYFTRVVSGSLQLLDCATTGGCNLIQSTTSSQGSFDVAVAGNYIVYGDVTNNTVYQCQIGGACVALSGQTLAYRTGGDSANAYWVAGSTQTQLNRAAAGSTAVSSVTSSGNLPFTADGTNVYFLSGSSFMRVPVGGGAPTTWITGVSAGKMKYVAGAVYFNDSTGAILRVATP